MKIGILAAGTWGTALAIALISANHEVTVWSILEDEINDLVANHRHKNLPGVVIPGSIVFTNDITRAVCGADVIINAAPSPYVRSTTEKFKKYLNDGQIIVSVAKGIESETLFTMSDVINDVLNNSFPVVALSGPTHAEEVARNIPTLIVSASDNVEAAKIVQRLFLKTCIRAYINIDIRGVELCGAFKNIIALACGIATGVGYGDNTKAAIMTRGLAEISNLGLAMGCLDETFSGLAGMGDLIVTATSQHSRNNRTGQYIGQGMKTTDAVKKTGMVVEGINALPAAMRLSQRYNIEMPIVNAVNDVINNGISVNTVIDRLLSRSIRSEHKKSYLNLKFERELLKRKRTVMKRVITYGTFDLLHYGHINLLKRAKALGDYLVVCLSTDEFNWNEKQKKCYFTYEQRKALLESIRYVDLVIPENNWEQKKSDVHEYHIDTFVIGDDWEGKFDFLKAEGVEVIYLPRTPEVSTTQIKKDLHTLASHNSKK